MSEAAVFGTLIAALFALIGVIYRALDKRLERLELRPVNGYGVLEEKVKSIERELGDRTHGIRGLLHDHSGYHTDNEGRFFRIEEKLNLAEWVGKKRRRED